MSTHSYYNEKYKPLEDKIRDILDTISANDELTMITEPDEIHIFNGDGYVSVSMQNGEDELCTFCFRRNKERDKGNE